MSSCLAQLISATTGCRISLALYSRWPITHPPEVASRKAAHAREFHLQVAGQGFDNAVAPAVPLLALGHELAQVLVEPDLQLVVVRRK